MSGLGLSKESLDIGYSIVNFASYLHRGKQKFPFPVPEGGMAYPQFFHDFAFGHEPFFSVVRYCWNNLCHDLLDYPVPHRLKVGKCHGDIEPGDAIFDECA